MKILSSILFNQKNRAKSKKKLDFFNFLLKIIFIIFISFIVSIIFRFQNYLIFVDDYLTFACGWIRFLIYVILIFFSLSVILKKSIGFKLKKVLFFTFLILFLSFFVENIFQLINDKKAFFDRESFIITNNRINIYIGNFYNFRNFIFNKINFYHLPWLDCRAGILGIVSVSITNFINVSVTTFISFIILLLLLSFLIFKKPFFILKKIKHYIFNLLSFFTFYHFIKSKISKIYFGINNYYSNSRKRFFKIFKKRKYHVYKHDKHILRFFKRQKTMHYHEIFNDREFYKNRWNWKNNKKDNFQGIYAFYVNNFHGKEKVILPCYIGKSNDIIIRWRSHWKKIDYAYKNPGNLSESLAVYQRVAAYLHANKLNPTDLRFIVLEWVWLENKLPKAEAYWINKIKTTQRGWNSIRA